jgi:DNA-binding transcriptional ArsR family regulator
LDYLKILDTTIVSLVLEKSLDYRTLMKESSRLIGRRQHISSNTFSSHLHKLLKKGILESKIEGRHVVYSITENAKKEERLKILWDDVEEMKYLKIYVKLLFYISTLNERWKSEHKYSVTAKANYSQNALISHINQLTAEVECRKSLNLPKYSEIPFILLSDMPPEARLEEAERFIAIKELDEEFRDRQLPSYKPPFYEGMLPPQPFPGMTIIEFLNSERSTNSRSKLTRDDIDKGVQLLKEEGIVKIRTRDGKTRIILINNDLLDFLTDLRYVCSKFEWRVLMIEFYFLREPNRNERRRIELLYGQKVTQEVLTNAKVNRYKFREVVEQYYTNNHDRVDSILQQCKLGAEYSFKRGINTIIKKYGKITQEYQSLHKVIEWICPMVLQ